MAQVRVNKKQTKIIFGAIFILTILLPYQTGREYIVLADYTAEEVESFAEMYPTIVKENREQVSGGVGSANGPFDFQSKLPKDMSGSSTNVGNGDGGTDAGGGESNVQNRTAHTNQTQEPTEEAVKEICSRQPTPAQIQTCTTDCVISNGVVGAACALLSIKFPEAKSALTVCEKGTAIASTQCGNMCDNAITVDCKTNEPVPYDGSQGYPGEFPYITNPAVPLFGQQ